MREKPSRFCSFSDHGAPPELQVCFSCSTTMDFRNRTDDIKGIEKNFFLPSADKKVRHLHMLLIWFCSKSNRHLRLVGCARIMIYTTYIALELYKKLKRYLSVDCRYCFAMKGSKVGSVSNAS